MKGIYSLLYFMSLKPEVDMSHSFYNVSMLFLCHREKNTRKPVVTIIVFKTCGSFTSTPVNCTTAYV
jgi:hypothetical protein